MGVPWDPAVPYLGIYPKELIGQMHKDICIRIFKAWHIFFNNNK